MWCDSLDSKPLVSILMPSFNSPDIYASIDSVLIQTYENMEFIIVDDCSTFFEAQKVRGYISNNAGTNLKRLLIIENETNLGTVKTMNKAFQVAQGKYLITLACDDLFYDENVVSDWTLEFENKQSLISTARYIDYDNSLTMLVKKQPSNKKIKIIRNSLPSQLFEDIIPLNYILGCATARSRECIEKYGLLDENYRLIDDYPNYLSLLRKGVKIDFFDRYVIKHRLGGISSSDRFMRGEYEIESDFILENEAFPYLDNDQEKRELYITWKKEVTKKSKYERLCDKWENNRYIKDLIFLRFNAFKMIKNPRYIIYIFKKRYLERKDK